MKSAATGGRNFSGKALSLMEGLSANRESSEIVLICVAKGMAGRLN
jgi:hypothetical protein